MVRRRLVSGILGVLLGWRQWLAGNQRLRVVLMVCQQRSRALKSIKGVLVLAVEGWRHFVCRRRRHRHTAKQIVRRWTHLELGPAMARWEEHGRERKRLARAAEKVVRRWQHMRIAPAVVRWEELWRFQKRLRQIFRKLNARCNISTLRCSICDREISARV